MTANRLALAVLFAAAAAAPAAAQTTPAPMPTVSVSPSPSRSPSPSPSPSSNLVDDVVRRQRPDEPNTAVAVVAGLVVAASGFGLAGWLVTRR